MIARRRIRFTPLIAAVVVTAACIPPAQPSVEPGLPEPVIDPTPDPSAAGPWSFMLADGVHRFEISSEAVVEDVTAATADTVALTVHVTYVRAAAATGAQDTVRGTVDSLAVSTTSADTMASPSAAIDTMVAPSGSVAPAPQMPIPFELVLDSTGRVVEVTSSDTSSCGSPTGAMLGLVRDAFPAVPHVLTIGMQWTDTTSSTSCRGDIPITQTSVRSHVVVGAERIGDTSGVRIRRETRIEISGTGTRRIQTTTVSGRGEGRSEIWIDPRSGRFLGSRGEAVLELTFDAASRQATFRQRSRLIVRPL